MSQPAVLNHGREAQNVLLRNPTSAVTYSSQYIEICRTLQGSEQSINQSHTHAHTHKQLFNGLLSRTTRVCCYQKKHSPTHTHPDHQTSFIIFLHPTIHGILFVQFTSLTVLSDNISPINQSIKNFRTGPSNRSRVFGLVKVIKQNADPFTLVIWRHCPCQQISKITNKRCVCLPQRFSLAEYNVVDSLFHVYFKCTDRPLLCGIKRRTATQNSIVSVLLPAVTFHLCYVLLMH